MTMITAFTAAAVLVAGIGFASAQTSAPTSDSGSKCWDVATNTAKDKPPTAGAPTTGNSAAGTTGSKAATAPAGSAPTTGMAPAPAAPAAGTTAARPAGMQNC